MNKNRLFILVSILTLAIVFITAASCNMCGKSYTIFEQTSQSNETTKEDLDLAKIEEEKAAIAEAESIQERDAQIKQEAIESEQNLTQGSESGNSDVYDGSEGSTAYEESGGESGPSVQSMTLPLVASESGYIAHPDGDPKDTSGYPYAGDSGNNKPCRGYASFDITGIQTPNINTASLTFIAYQKLGDPSFYPSFGLFSLYYGPVPISVENFSADHNLLEYVDITTISNFTISGEILKNEIQSAINAGRSRFQIEINPLSPWTNNDNDWDGVNWRSDGIILDITYLS